MTILKKPLVTEKFTAIGEKLNKVSFIVAKTATKREIKKIIKTVDLEWDSNYYYLETIKFHLWLKYAKILFLKINFLISLIK